MTQGGSSTLSVAGVDVIVVTTTTAVAESEPVFMFLSRLANATMQSQTWSSHKRSGLTDIGFSDDVAAVVSEKAVYKAGRVSTEPRLTCACTLPRIAPQSRIPRRCRWARWTFA